MKNTAKGLMVLVLVVIVTGGVFAQTQGFAVGARAIGTIPFYKPSSDFERDAGFSVDLEGDFGFGAAVQASFNFTDLIGIQAEVIYNSDTVKVKALGIEAATIKASSLLLPVLVRVGTSFWNGIELTGLAGVYYTLPLGDGEVSLSPLAGGGSAKGAWTGSFGAMAGGVVGYRLGPGALFADVRYAFDFFDSEFDFGGEKQKVLSKSAIHIGIGYALQFGRW